MANNLSVTEKWHSGHDEYSEAKASFQLHSILSSEWQAHRVMNRQLTEPTGEWLNDETSISVKPSSFLHTRVVGLLDEAKCFSLINAGDTCPPHATGRSQWQYLIFWNYALLVLTSAHAKENARYKPLIAPIVFPRSRHIATMTRLVVTERRHARPPSSWLLMLKCI